MAEKIRFIDGQKSSKNPFAAGVTLTVRRQAIAFIEDVKRDTEKKKEIPVKFPKNSGVV